MNEPSSLDLLMLAVETLLPLNLRLVGDLDLGRRRLEDFVLGL